MPISQKQKIISLLKSASTLNDTERENLIDTLKATPGTQTVPVLINSLNDPDPFVRKFSIIILGERREKNAILPIIEKLKDPDVGVLIASIMALGEIGDKRATPSLVPLLEDESSFFYFIRLNAANALAKIGDINAVPFFVKTIKQDDIILMRSIVEALITIEPKSAIEPLIEILNDKDALSKDQAIEFLGMIGGNEVIEPLLNVLEEKNSETNICAVQALGKRGNEDVLIPLFDIYSREKEEFLKYSIGEAIKNIIANVENQINIRFNFEDNISRELIEKFVSLAKEVKKHPHYIT